MSSKKAPQKKKARDDFRAWADSVGNVEYGVLAANTPPRDDEAAARAGRALVGALPTRNAARHADALGQLFKELQAVSRSTSSRPKKQGVRRARKA